MTRFKKRSIIKKQNPVIPISTSSSVIPPKPSSVISTVTTTKKGPVCEENSDCINNGVCKKGVCKCDFYWTGDFCETRKFTGDLYSKIMLFGGVTIFLICIVMIAVSASFHQDLEHFLLIGQVRMLLLCMLELF